MTGKKPERVDIEQGISDDSMTEITSSSINEGDKVITGIKNKGGKKGSGTRRPMRMF